MDWGEYPDDRRGDGKNTGALKIRDYSSNRVTGHQRSIPSGVIIPGRLSTSVAYRGTSQRGLFTFYFSPAADTGAACWSVIAVRNADASHGLVNPFRMKRPSLSPGFINPLNGAIS